MARNKVAKGKGSEEQLVQPFITLYLFCVFFETRISDIFEFLPVQLIRLVYFFYILNWNIVWPLKLHLKKTGETEMTQSRCQKVAIGHFFFFCQNNTKWILPYCPHQKTIWPWLDGVTWHSFPFRSRSIKLSGSMCRNINNTALMKCQLSLGRLLFCLIIEYPINLSSFWLCTCFALGTLTYQRRWQCLINVGYSLTFPLCIFL